ncbi:hypothetical protein ACFCV9_17245 [Streptomyces sp. NPDC056367]|uniref:hypothetical protein n=1 Tax=Streptomyces sp. NPDC056367 TaxID=3345797 RepID=UPI0035E02B57
MAAALKGWSDCMAKGGYGGVGTPYEVIEKLGLHNDESGPKAVAVATKDVACKREVNLVGIWAAAERAYQERLVDEHAETLALYKKQRGARFACAASLARRAAGTSGPAPPAPLLRPRRGPGPPGRGRGSFTGRAGTSAGRPRDRA